MQLSLPRPLPFPLAVSSAFRLLPLLLGLTGCGTAYLEREAAGIDYRLQGEYAAEGAAHAAQVIARGNGAFELVLYRGGLPGAGWDGRPPQRIAGARVGQAEAHFSAAAFDATIANQALRLRGLGDPSGGHATDAGSEVHLRRVERRSPTQGAVAPPGAQVVFASGEMGGAAVNATDGEVDERGWLAAGAESRDAFGSMALHLEFQTPFMPTSSGQARGNSGVYLQGRYEVQVLDSFGLDAATNDCAAIYEIAAPRLNMSFPPLQWQTYDIDFEAATFDAHGEKLRPARITVRHNGVLVHERVAIPRPTGLGDAEGPAPGRLLLQNHLNPVYYRNIWVVPR